MVLDLHIESRMVAALTSFYVLVGLTECSTNAFEEAERWTLSLQSEPDRYEKVRSFISALPVESSPKVTTRAQSRLDDPIQVDLVRVQSKSGVEATHRRIHSENSKEVHPIEIVQANDLSSLKKATIFEQVDLVDVEIPKGKDVRWLQEQTLGVSKESEFPFHFVIQEREAGDWEIVQVTPLNYEFALNPRDIRIGILRYPAKSADVLPSETEIKTLGTLLDGLGTSGSALQKEAADSNVSLKVKRVTSQPIPKSKYSPFLEILRDRFFTQRSYKTGNP